MLRSCGEALRFEGEGDQRVVLAYDWFAATSVRRASAPNRGRRAPLDRCEGEAADVDEVRVAFNVRLHQIEDVCAAGDVARAGAGCGGDRVGWSRGRA